MLKKLAILMIAAVNLAGQPAQIIDNLEFNEITPPPQIGSILPFLENKKEVEIWNRIMPNGMITFLGNSVHYGTDAERLPIVLVRYNGGWTVVKNYLAEMNGRRLWKNGFTWPPSLNNGGQIYWTNFGELAPSLPYPVGYIHKWAANNRNARLVAVANAIAKKGTNMPVEGVFLNEENEYAILPSNSVSEGAKPGLARIIQWGFAAYETVVPFSPSKEYVPLGPVYPSDDIFVFWGGKTEGGVIKPAIIRFDRQTKKEEVLISYGQNFAGERVLDIQSVKAWRGEAMVVFTTPTAKKIAHFPLNGQPKIVLSNASLARNVSIASAINLWVSDFRDGRVLFSTSSNGDELDSVYELDLRDSATKKLVSGSLLGGVGLLGSFTQQGYIFQFNSWNGARLFEAKIVPPPPVIPPNITMVVNGANFEPLAVSPCTIATMFGTKLNPSGTAAAKSLPLPRELGRTQVLINNNPVPLFFVSDGQINFQVPCEIDARENLLTVVTTAGDGARLASTPFKFTPRLVSPGIFKHEGLAITTKLNGELVTRNNPLVADDYFIIYTTGLGAVSPAVTSGEPAPAEPLSRTVANTTIKVGGIEAEVLFSGLAPGFAGLYQINARVPPETSAGEQWLEVIANGSRDVSKIPAK